MDYTSSSTPVHSGTYHIDNGSAGNGNALMQLLGVAGYQATEQAGAPQGSAAAGDGGKSGGGFMGGYFNSPITPHQILLFVIAFLAIVGLIVVIHKHL